jgi:hypothetical protein
VLSFPVSVIAPQRAGSYPRNLGATTTSPLSFSIPFLIQTLSHQPLTHSFLPRHSVNSFIINRFRAFLTPAEDVPPLCPSFFLAPGHSPLATNPFRIIPRTHTNRLNPLQSHTFKNRGGGGPLRCRQGALAFTSAETESSESSLPHPALLRHNPPRKRLHPNCILYRGRFW